MNPIKSMLAAATMLMGVTAMAAPAAADTVVLVHGMNMDASAWHKVRDRLMADGHTVALVQLPMTLIGDDIAAAKRVIDAQSEPVVLVGHSYGGMVISQAGADPKVKALVYVAAFLPEVGESLAELNTSEPAALPADGLQVYADGFYTVKQDAWVTNVANGTSEDEARNTAIFQRPVNTQIFGYEAEKAAWRDKPTFAAVATQDRTIAPKLLRHMAERAGAQTVEIDGGHLLPLSHPGEVVKLIERAGK